MKTRIFRDISIAVIALCASWTLAAEPIKIASSAERTSLKKDDVIVFLGDSITAGCGGFWRQRILEAYPALGLTIVNAGVGGNKVPQCQERLDRDVLQKKPTVVIIYIGINDVWHFHWNCGGTSKEDFEAGLKDMIARINAVGARVILCTPTVIGEKIDGTNIVGDQGHTPLLDPILEEYSNISRKVAREMKSQLLDLHTEFMKYLKVFNTENAISGILTSDGVHLSMLGRYLVAELMLEALNAPKPALQLKGRSRNGKRILLDVGAATVEGDWRKGEGNPILPPGFLHEGYDKKTGKKSVTFDVTVKDPGKYQVKFLYTTHKYRATNTPVAVVIGDQRRDFTVNQRQSDGAGFTLGTFRIEKSARIIVSNAGTDGHVVVDGIEVLAESEIAD